MIAATILAGLALYFAQLMSNTAKQQRTTEANAEIASLENTIKGIAQSNTQCDLNFKGKKAGDTISGLKVSSSQSSYAIESGQVRTGSKASVKSMKLSSATTPEGSRSQISLEVVFIRESDPNATNRTTLGPLEITKTITFFALPCDYVEIPPDPALGVWCANSISDAVDICEASLKDKSMTNQSGETVSFGEDVNCDPNPDSSPVVTGDDGSCYGLLAYGNCSSTNTIAKCDN